ncbi:MAG: glycosyltransferase family 39 protein [Bacteroidales bacterium]|nr:glycosyltransferase family 39 protein [Bacteroidales bacterium]
MKISKARISLFAFVFISFYVIFSNFKFFPHQIICYDVYGYYMYLPQKFIYNDIPLQNVEQTKALLEKYENSSTFYQAFPHENGNYIYKYSMGLAIMYSPAFFTAHALSSAFGYPADGYSYPYQLALLIWGIILSIIAIWILRKILLHFFNDITTTITLILIVAATNIPIHTAMYGQNAMSHNYLLLLYALAIWFTIKWHENKKISQIIILGIVSGLAILSRPTEIIILLFPALWNVYNFKTLKDKFVLVWSKKFQIILFSFIIIAIGLSQVIYWKIYTGEFLYYSYKANPGEGLEFFRPYIYEVLFSFRKGLFIYTPIVVFALFGLIILWKKHKKSALAITIYLIVNLYIISCWSTWWYANSYSQRSFIPALIALSIPLGFLIKRIIESKALIKIIFTIIGTLLIFLNIFQIWQFHNGILDGERMTKEYYLKIFLKTNVDEADKKLLLIDRSYYNINNFDNEAEYTGHTISTLDFEESNIDSIAPLHGLSYCILDSIDTYSPKFEARHSELTKKDHAWVRATIDIYVPKSNREPHFAFVIHFTHKGAAYQYRSMESGELNLEKGKWNSVQFDYLTPEVREKSDSIRTLVWNINGETILVDNLNIEIFEKVETDTK